MTKNELTVRYSAEEIAKLPSETDWDEAGKLEGAALEAAIAADPDEAGLVFDWTRASIEMPQPKAVLNMRVDRQVLDFFRATGPGYQTRINAVLAAYVRQVAGK